MFIILFYFVGFFMLYNHITKESFLERGLCIFFILFSLCLFLNIIFEVENLKILNIELVFILYFIMCKTSSHLVGDKVNNKYVCIIFYKPRTFKQFLLFMIGLSYSSAGLIINQRNEDGSVSRKIYQMRYEKDTLQEKDYDTKWLYKKYLVIKTDIEISKLPKNWKEELLSQKARQTRTFFLRFNCLRSLKNILNLSKIYAYHGEIFPAIYLLRLKFMRIIT